MTVTSLNIFSRIKNYLKLSREIQEVLLRSPDDALKFQEIFNLTVDRIYQDIMDFEKENIKNSESGVYKLKKIFEKRYRRYFLYGEYIKWCAEKPFGYSGDYKIINDIYQNQVRTTGFDRLWDNWFQQLAASCAVRARKEELKKIIFDFIEANKGRKIRIMNLGCGPAREIKELLEAGPKKLFSKVTFDCYDFDIRAIEYAKNLLNGERNVNFFQKNAVRLALKNNIEDEIRDKYNLIYSSGLFDYLDERIGARLLANLRKILKDGIMVISNFRDKYSNSSSVWMEWIGDWYLIYRTEEEFKRIFLNAGFSSKELEIIAQKSNVVQYCITKK